MLTASQRFVRDGCPNCESFLDLAGHPDSVQECTSQVYEGLITLANPEKSWVAKWQRLDGYVPGVYAVKVVGMVSLNEGQGMGLETESTDTCDYSEAPG